MSCAPISARRGQSWREDSSESGRHASARPNSRHHILPTLERDLQPAVVSGIFGRLAQLAREEEAFWQAMIAERLHTLARWEQSETRPKTQISGDARTSEVIETRGPRRGIRCADLLAPLPWMDAGCSEEIRLAVTRRLVRGIIEESCKATARKSPHSMWDRCCGSRSGVRAASALAFRVLSRNAVSTGSGLRRHPQPRPGRAARSGTGDRPECGARRKIWERWRVLARHNFTGCCRGLCRCCNYRNWAVFPPESH